MVANHRRKHFCLACVKVSPFCLILSLFADTPIFHPELASIATSFLVYISGFAEYNCSTNSSKTVVNFDCGMPACTIPASGKHVVSTARNLCMHHKLSTSICQIFLAPFPWCGLLIDPHSLEISMDYSRYCGLSELIFLPVSFSIFSKVYPHIMLVTQIYVNLNEWSKGGILTKMASITPWA